MLKPVASDRLEFSLICLKSRFKTVTNREFEQEWTRFEHAVRPFQNAGFPGGLPENDQILQPGGSGQNKVTGCTFSVYCRNNRKSVIFA